MFSVLSGNNLFAQNTTPPFCATCTAEDIKMVGVDIVTGNNGNCYNPGDNVTGFFKFKLDVTAKQRYGLVIYFEIWVDGVPRGKYYTCMDKIFDQGYQEIETFNGNKFPVPAGIPAGQIMVKNMFTAWDNQYPDLVCGKTSFTSGGDANTSLDETFSVDCFQLSPKCKFYAEVPLVNLAVKPSVTLASIMPSLCPGGTSTSLNFTNRSSGADEYQIAYDNAASRAGFMNISYQLLGSSPINLSVPSGAASGVYNGVLTLRNTISGCESQPYNFTVTVKENVFVATQPSVAETYCTSGPGPQLSVTAGGESPYTYQWYANGSSSNNGGSLIDGATANTYEPSVSNIGTSYYYVVLNGGCGPTVNSNPVTVLVNKNTSISDGGNPYSPKEYCKNEAASALTVSADGANLIYQWYRSSTNQNIDGTAIANATNNSYSPSTSAEGAMYYYVVVGGACGTVTSDAARVFVKKSTVINSQPTGATYCTFSTPVDLQVSADGHNIRYQWYINSSNGTAGATAIEAATNASYKPSITNTGTAYYFVKVTGDCGEVNSNPAAIVVDPSTQIATQPASTTTYCKNATATSLSVVASGKSLSYQWYMNTNNANSGGTAISGETTASYKPSTLNDGRSYYYVVVTGACGTVTSGVSEIVVNKLTSINSHPQGNAIAYCPSSTPAALTVTADGTALSYQWFVNSSNSTAGSSVISGATNTSYTPSVSQSGTKYYYVQVSGSCGSVNSDLASISVDPATQIASQSVSSATYCRNVGAQTLSVSGSGVNVSYQWYMNSTNSTLNGTSISGETNASYTPPTITNGTTYYYVIVSGKCGSVASSVATIVVNKITEIRTQPQSNNYCVDGYIPPLIVAAVGTSITYQWYSSNSNSTVGGTAISGAKSFTYFPSSSVGSAKYYYVVVTGTCGTVTSSVATITLAKNTVINNALSNAEYCQDATATSFNIAADGEQLNYQWYSNTVASIDGASTLLGQTNASFTPPTNIPGTLYYYVVVNGFCGQNQISNFASVLVKGRPAIQTQPIGTTYCKDATTTALSVVATGSGLNYQWYSNSVNSTIGGVALGTGSTQSIASSVVGTTYYYVDISGACSPSVASDVVSISVIEKAEITKQPVGYTLCRTAEGKPLNVEATGVGKTYEWFRSFTGAEGTFTSIPNATDASYMPDVSVVGTMYYYVVVNSASCGSVKSNVVSVLVTDCGAFCTYTQGYYGNDGGTSNYLDGNTCKSSNTYNAIASAIAAFGEDVSGVKTITFGAGENKLILRNTDADIKKVIELLPGGGTSGVIGGNYTMQTIGAINNTLLAQTMTLALNLGLNKGGNMIGYPLQSKYLKTEKAKSCGKDGGYGTFDCADFTMLSNDLDVDGMPGLTINDVWIVANKMLAGEAVGNVDYGQITAIVDGLNKGWDECRISIEWLDSKGSCGQAYTIANNGIESVAYPNPFVTKVNISFKSLASGNATILLYDITGRKIGFIYRPNVIAGTKNLVEYNVPINSPSVIFYRVTIGDKFATGKVIAASR